MLKRHSVVIPNFYSPFPGELPNESIRLKTVTGEYYEL